MENNWRSNSHDSHLESSTYARTPPWRHSLPWCLDHTTKITYSESAVRLGSTVLIYYASAIGKGAREKISLFFSVREHLSLKATPEDFKHCGMFVFCAYICPMSCIGRSNCFPCCQHISHITMNLCKCTTHLSTPSVQELSMYKAECCTDYRALVPCFVKGCSFLPLDCCITARW